MLFTFTIKWVFFYKNLRSKLFVSFVDFLGKIEEDGVWEVLRVAGDERLQPLVAVVLVAVVALRHAQRAVQTLHLLHALLVVARITSLGVQEEDIQEELSI